MCKRPETRRSAMPSPIPMGSRSSLLVQCSAALCCALPSARSVPSLSEVPAAGETGEGAAQPWQRHTPSHFRPRLALRPGAAIPTTMR